MEVNDESAMQLESLDAHATQAIILQHGQLDWQPDDPIISQQQFQSPTIESTSFVPTAPTQHDEATTNGQLINLDYFDLQEASRMNWFEGAEDDERELSTLHGLPSQLLTNTIVRPLSWSHMQALSTFQLHDETASPVGDAMTTISTESPAESHQHSPSEYESGQYYVDGDQARLTKFKRRPLRKSCTGPSPRQALPDNNFSLAHDDMAYAAFVDPEMAVPAPAYALLEMWYTDLCSQTRTAPAFVQSDFPSIVIFGYLIHLYHSNFGVSLPIIHRAATLTAAHTALQALAMASIGTHYVPDNLASDLFSASLHEMLTRVLALQLSQETTHSTDAEVLARVRLLQAVASIYSGNDSLIRRALEDSNPIPAAYRAARKRFAIPDQEVSQTEDTQFQAWLAREQSVRLMCAAWQLDYMWKYHFHTEPRLTVGDAIMPLPCNAKLWNVTTPGEWAELSRTLPPSQTVSIAALLSELYVDKSTSTDISDFGTSLLVHGILRRTHEVGLFYDSPLSSYVPSPRPQKSIEVLPDQPIWLPSVPEFARWQNSACDAIDILHWQANAAIALASGMEHPSVLHLHISRVVLLVPYDNIMSIAHAWAANSPISITDRDLLRRWVTEGQYKARLAVIHAGVSFWHIRRYSTDAFYEPAAIALATLTLWAFATFANHKRRRHDTNLLQVDQDDKDVGIILLDRPTDDELVQEFIRNGADMRTFLTGIGDLYDAAAPKKVLQQGCSLLETLTCWGIHARWLDLFNRLIALHA